jgi:hypothetical protein
VLFATPDEALAAMDCDTRPLTCWYDEVGHMTRAVLDAVCQISGIIHRHCYCPSLPCGMQYILTSFSTNEIASRCCPSILREKSILI